MLSTKEYDECDNEHIASDNNMRLFEKLVVEENIRANLEWIYHVKKEEPTRRYSQIDERNKR